MEPSTASPAAPAQPAAAEPTIQTAAHAAVATGNTSDYRAARRAERAGKPLSTVATPPAALAPPAAAASDLAAPAPPAEPKLSRKDREQQEINDRIRSAVDRATADLRAEIARRPAAPRSETPAPAPPAAPTVDEFPEIDEWAARPENAGKSFKAYVKELNAFDRQQADTAAQSRATSEALTVAQQARVDTFVQRLTDTKTADPAFVSKLTPDVLALKPFSGLKPGEEGGPANVVTEQIYDSPIGPQVLLYLSQHPEELRRLTTVPAEIAAKPAAVRSHAHIQYIVREFGKLEGRLEAASPAAPAAAAVPTPKTLTDAPAAPAALGTRTTEVTDPKVAAIRNNDTRAYRTLRREERAAARR